MAKERYHKTRMHGHPNATVNGQIRTHVLVMSQLLGRHLNKGEVVHHIDNNSFNNDPSNLMLFASNSEHLKHHAKEEAFKETGNRNYMKCPYCKQYDNPENMYLRPAMYQAWHRECRNKHQRTSLIHEEQYGI